MSNNRPPLFSILTAGLLATATCIGTLTFAGCERKERLLDVDTPEGTLEVNRNVDTGEVEVEITDKD